MRVVRGVLLLGVFVGLLSVGSVAFGESEVSEEGSRWQLLRERVVEFVFGASGDEESPPEDEDGGGGMIDPNG